MKRSFQKEILCTVQEKEMKAPEALVFLKAVGTAIGRLHGNRVLVEAHMLGFNQWLKLRDSYRNDQFLIRPREWSPRDPFVKGVQGVLAMMGLKLEEVDPEEQEDSVKVGLRIIYRGLEALKKKDPPPSSEQLTELAIDDFTRDEGREPKI